MTWSGAWENSTDYYGTFDIEIRLTGNTESLQSYGSSDTAAAALTWKEHSGKVLSSSDLLGTWENDRSSDGSGMTSISLSSADADIEFENSGYYGLAGGLDDNTFMMVQFVYYSKSGNWHSCPEDRAAACPAFDSATSLSSTGDFLDAALIETDLYAVILDDAVYSVNLINPANGTLIKQTTDCPSPRAIAYDGTNLWLAGIVGETWKLYKYAPADLSSAVESAVTLQAGGTPAALSSSVSALYYHNGNVLLSEIGSINTSTNSLSLQLSGGFDGLASMNRPHYRLRRDSLSFSEPAEQALPAEDVK